MADLANVTVVVEENLAIDDNGGTRAAMRVYQNRVLTVMSSAKVIFS